MKTVVALLHCLLRLIALPISPVGYDRLVAYRMYVARLDRSTIRRQRQHRGSLLRRLGRAARRQELLNRINLPGYLELQRRKWQRRYNYGLILRRLTIFFAVGYAADCVEKVLKTDCPTAYSAWIAGCRAIVMINETMWQHLVPDRPPWT